MAHIADEETSLLHIQHLRRRSTPLPWRQFGIILFLQLVEPLTSQLISPLAPQRTTVNTGISASPMVTRPRLGSTSDSWPSPSFIGAGYPIVLVGSPVLLMASALSGALNGNIGVTKSMMAEITDETTLAQAYAYTPIAWSSGSTLGLPLSPCRSFFQRVWAREILENIHYSLACAVPATFTAIAWIVTFLFLKERRSDQVALESPKSSTTTLATSENAESRPLPLGALLIPRVLIAAGNYAALSTIDITFRAVQPLFYATPIELGGLGLDPPLIGNILAVYGTLSGLFQILFFASFHDRFGSKALYTVSVLCGIPLVLTFPVINTLARVYGLNWAVCRSFKENWWPASPNRGCLGATNGLAQVLVSIMRSIGPASAASMFSLSIEAPAHGWFVYCYLLVVVVIGIGASLLLPRKLWEN
ncbi:MFS multidrug-resistance DHA1 sub-family [Pisolithus sp. B1]|nr:MFS multidrug-resistance DHA1 sub-family [Pisolithus sp. B1]